jgi:hypothetical protein
MHACSRIRAGLSFDNSRFKHAQFSRSFGAQIKKAQTWYREGSAEEAFPEI